MMRPTQPITPEMATHEAVRRVAHTMQMRRRAATLTPSDCASSSPKARMLKRHRRASRGTTPRMKGTEETVRSFHVTLAMEPMSQYVISGSLESGSAVYLTVETIAWKRAETISPHRTSSRT